MVAGFIAEPPSSGSRLSAVYWLFFGLRPRSQPRRRSPMPSRRPSPRWLPAPSAVCRRQVASSLPPHAVATNDSASERSQRLVECVYLSRFPLIELTIDPAIALLN